MTEARPPYGAIPPVHPATEQSAVALLAAFAAEHPEAFENYCAGHGEDIDWADAYRSDSPGLRAQPADPVPLPPPSGHGTRQCLRLALSLDSGCEKWMWEFFLDGERLVLAEMPSFHDRLPSPREFRTIFRCQLASILPTDQVTAIVLETLNLDHINIEYLEMNDDSKPHTGNGFKILKKTATPKPDNPRGFQP